MKLISMTDFVLSQTELLYDKNQSKLIHNIVNYAQFLKQSLKLEMFVPCDEDGNVLEEPTNYEVWEEIYLKDKSSIIGFKEHESYFEAKEKVLFEGLKDIVVIEIHISRNRTIEYLSKFSTIYLTQNAIKQIGL